MTRANRDLELGDNEPSQDHAYPTTRVGGICLARVLFNCTVSRRNLRVRLRGTIAHANRYNRWLRLHLLGLA